MEKELVGVICFYFIYIIYLMFFMFFRRKKRIKEGVIRTSHFRSYSGESSEELVIIQNHYTNQFQIPVIFMISLLLSIQLGNANQLVFIFALIFVISRIVHSYVHLTYNNVLHRAFAYFVGVLSVLSIFIINLVG